MTPPYLGRLGSEASEPQIAGSRKSSAMERVNLKKNKNSIDISLKKSIDLLDHYDNLIEHHDDLSAQRVLHNADDDNLKFKT